MTRFINSRIVLLAIVVAIVLTVALIVGRAQPHLPRVVRIAAGPAGGLYYETAQAIADRIHAQTGVRVALITTNGDLDNRRLLQSHQADIGLLQVSSENVAGLVAVTPLYDEVVQVIVRNGRGIRTIRDLDGRRVLLGPLGSGTRTDAERILQVYDVKTATMPADPAWFQNLETDPTIDAAFITTGFLNPDVQRLMSTGRYSILELSHPHAFIVRYPFYKLGVVPAGLYGSNPATPAADVPVLTVRCYLATQQNADDSIVTASLNAIYTGNLRHEIPVLVPQGDAKTWLDEPIHPAAQHFFDPYSNLSLVSNVLQGLSSLKELLVALATFVYLSFRLVTNRREAAKEEELRRQKEHLDTLIEATITLDKTQSLCTDPSLLEIYRLKALDLKNMALHDLTHETLRSNQMFTVYFLQVTSLIDSIESRIFRLSNTVIPKEEAFPSSHG